MSIEQAYTCVMTNAPILAEASSRLAQARAEVARLEAFLEVYRELDTGSPKVARVRTRHTMATSGAVADSASAALEHIRVTGRAVSTRELVTVLTAKGIEIGGNDPIATLSARLSRSPLLTNIRGAGWQAASASEEETAGDLLHSNPAVSGSTLHSADGLPGGGA